LAEEVLVIQRALVAALLGGIIGLERELRGKPAGLRTHALVATGAAVFATIFPPGTDQSSRVIANIVTGIGFIGAGAIFRAEGRVVGLTTAAEVWVLASIGILSGLGLYLSALSLTALVLLVLVPAQILERKLRGRSAQ